MDMPAKFNGMTDEQIGVFLNVDNNIEGLVASEITWLLLNKQNVVNIIDFDHLDNFNEKIKITDFSNSLTSQQVITIINDPTLVSISKTGEVEEVEEYPSGNITVKNRVTIKLDLSSLSSAISSSGSSESSGPIGLLSGSNFINEIIGVVSILDLVVNELPKTTLSSTAVSQNLNTMFGGLFTGISNLASNLTNVPADIAKSIDPGFGFTNAIGGSSNAGTSLGYGGGQAPASSTSTAGQSSTGTIPDTTLYKKLDDILTMTLRQDWKTKNAKPGNPLILEAYALSGRNYDKDGTTGEYAWSAAYVNWVLNKAGLDYLKVMSPAAYAGYGSPVNFGTFKNVRKNDIIVYKSSFGIGIAGFVMGYDPATDMVSVLGGNQGGTVKITKLPGLKVSPELYVSHIRRNWAIPSELDVPLFQTAMPTRPGQQVSGPATLGLPTIPGQETSGPLRIDYSNGTGSLGGTFV